MLDFLVPKDADEWAFFAREEQKVHELQRLDKKSNRRRSAWPARMSKTKQVLLLLFTLPLMKWKSCVFKWLKATT